MKRATQAEKAHLAYVKSLPCVRCQEMGREQTTPTTVHHVRVGSAYKDHFKVIPLCRRSPLYPVGTDCHGDVERSRSKFRLSEERWLAALHKEGTE